MENIKNEAQRMVPTESIARQMTEHVGHLENKRKNRRNGALVVIDEQPPVGDNTTNALYMISMQAIKQKTPVAYFTPTLSNVQVVNRLISMETGISLEKIEAGTLTEQEWQILDERMPLLTDAPLYIDDTQKTTFDELSDKIARLATDNGVRIVFINPVSQMDIYGMDFNDITSKLNTLAAGLGIVIFAIKD
jgi:replicative DNA helicase